MSYLDFLTIKNTEYAIWVDINNDKSWHDCIVISVGKLLCNCCHNKIVSGDNLTINSGKLSKNNQIKIVF